MVTYPEHQTMVEAVYPAGIADSISVFKGDHNRIVDNHVTGGDRGIILMGG